MGRAEGAGVPPAPAVLLHAGPPEVTRGRTWSVGQATSREWPQWPHHKGDAHSHSEEGALGEMLTTRLCFHARKRIPMIALLLLF